MQPETWEHLPEAMVQQLLHDSESHSVDPKPLRPQDPFPWPRCVLHQASAEG